MKKLSNDGKTLAESNGCTSCHTIDGGAGAGPTWAGMWGAPAPAAAPSTPRTS